MRLLFGSILTGMLVAAPAAAQTGPSTRGGPWKIGLTIGTSTFNGASTGTDDAGSSLVFRPYRPTMLGVALTYGRERARIGLSAKYGQPGLGIRGVSDDGSGGGSAGLLIVAENAFHLASGTVTAGTCLAKLRGGPALRASLGITLEHWSAPGTPSRNLLGPQAGVAIEFAISGSWFASVDGELGFTPGSPFQRGDLPEGFRLRSTWRRTLQAGVSLRL
ncbi:MAG TPA: hypothetical protein VFU23_03785 [Gemmatimonadales bacterium]|nr:hypothetical protein [Gemmatimonadales bacterium]